MQAHTHTFSESGSLQQRILWMSDDRPPQRPCPPSRPRGPADSWRLV